MVNSYRLARFQVIEDREVLKYALAIMLESVRIKTLLLLLLLILLLTSSSLSLLVLNAVCVQYYVLKCDEIQTNGSQNPIE
jgi:hypothetical protein